MSFNVYSTPTGKRLNSDSFQVEDQSLKKQRVFDEPLSPSTSATLITEGKTGDVNSLTIRNQSNKLMMTFVQNQSIIETANDEPHAQLLLNLYSTQLVDHIMDSPTYTYDEQQVWSLAALLFGQEQTVNNSSSSTMSPPTPSPTIASSSAPGASPIQQQQQQLRRLKNWICSTLIEEMQVEDTLNVEGDGMQDIWKRAFYYMSSGQVVKACELVQQMGDEALVAMLVAHFQQEEGVRAAAERQVAYWDQHGLFDPLPLCQRKMWYVLQGRLGYVDAMKQVVTQDLPWSQVLLLYTLYGCENENDPLSGLATYHAITTTTDDSTHLSQLQTINGTAQVPHHCQWYALLQWWITYSSSGTFTAGATYRKRLETRITLRCRWLLLLHVPALFANERTTLETWKHQWCDELYHSGLEYMAILAGLFLTRPGPKIKQLLSMRQWDKEHYVARQLQIPPEWIIDAKALYALNHRLYDKQADCYLEANENEKARDAILNHMIPALFLDNEKIDMVNAYLRQLSALFSGDTDLQQTISMLRNIQIILNDYPRILSQSSPSSEQLASMANELALAVQNVGHFGDQMFCSKLAAQLLSTASLFMADEQLNMLMENCPVEIDANQSIVERLSYTMSTRISRK